VVVVLRPESVATTVADALRKAGAEPVVIPAADAALRAIRTHGAKGIVIALSDKSLSGKMLSLREIRLPIFAFHSGYGPPDVRLLERARRFGVADVIPMATAGEQWPSVVRQLRAARGLDGEPDWLRAMGATPSLDGMEVVEVDTEFAANWSPEAVRAKVALSREEIDAFADGFGDSDTSETDNSRMSDMVSVRASAPDSLESLSAIETRLRADLERMVEVMVRQRTSEPLRGSTGVMNLVRSIVEGQARKTELRLQQKILRATQGWEMRVHEIASAVSAQVLEQARLDILSVASKLKQELRAQRDAAQSVADRADPQSIRLGPASAADPAPGAVHAPTRRRWMPRTPIIVAAAVLVLIASVALILVGAWSRAGL